MTDSNNRYLRGLQHAMRTLETNADDLGWVERDMARDAVSKAIAAALASQEASRPDPVEGWVMVPKEPTADMFAAGNESMHVPFDFSLAGNVYRAMLAAAPSCHPEAPSSLSASRAPLSGHSESDRSELPAMPGGELRAALVELIATSTRDAYWCTRVWDAWRVGTMSEDDFAPVEESEFPGELADSILALLVPTAAPVSAPADPKLTVWYGSMPESNGRTNWTATLHREGSVYDGFTFARSEYPHRVRYEADCMRHLIGKLADDPDILAYDSDELTPCHLCGGTGEKDGKPCWGLKFDGTVHAAPVSAAVAAPPEVSMPLEDAQMLLSWMDETFGNDGGDDWFDADAAAVGDALGEAIKNFQRMRAALATPAQAVPQRLPLAEAQIDAIQLAWIQQTYTEKGSGGSRGFARAIEAAHGIVATPAQQDGEQR